MSTPERQTPRERRRRHEHERQAVVFGLIIAVLAVIAVGALAVYTGAVDPPFDKQFFAKDDARSQVQQPCIPDDTKPVPYEKVKVDVLNASGEIGVAKITGNMLTERGFTVVSLGNATQKLDYIEISSNKKTLAAAYTVAAQFDSPVIALDDRKAGTVSVTVGSDFQGMIDDDDVGLTADSTLKSVKGCVPVDEITPEHVPTPTPSATKAG
ncbi:LytR C-terminal domain-containing protein [Cellulomonas sp. PhB143]|uniref:LytR C-terminal domain-containing protein n=1 Tax=Cellulomonas sp. PhB143 TaxID=2485186 RepID=UPI000F4803AE|nr:LytR C-terminal domain-containing protein [Cellulomonas sp. PhB143]ROS78929.1 LytR cell envelope-related transcriptional attenuator [Cellulomonas sp. PhB143]